MELGGDWAGAGTGGGVVREAVEVRGSCVVGAGQVRICPSGRKDGQERGWLGFGDGKQSGGGMGSWIWAAGMNWEEKAEAICLDLLYWKCRGPGWPLTDTLWTHWVTLGLFVLCA